MDRMRTEEISASRFSHAMLFIYQIDISKIKHHTYYAFLLLLFYFQLYSIILSIQTQPPSDVLFKIFWKLCEFTNMNAVFSSLNSPFIGIGLIASSIIADGFFLSSIYQLSKASTSVSSNTLERRRFFISCAALYCDISKWALLIPKLDFAIAAIHPPQNAINRIFGQVPFSKFPASILIGMGIISLLLTMTVTIIASMAYFNIEFQRSNPLKPKASFSAISQFLLIMLIVIFCYFPVGGSYIATYFAALLFALNELKTYYTEFPSTGKSVISIFGSANLSFIAAVSLAFIRDIQPRRLEDSAHIFILLVIASILTGFNEIIIRSLYNQLYSVNLKQQYCKPRIAYSYLGEISELLLRSVSDYSAWVLLLGMLETHQIECEDCFCPCQEGSSFAGLNESEIREKKKEHSKMSCDQGIAIPPQGVWLSEMRKDYEQFKIWAEDFIEYHFYQIVEFQSKKTRVKQDIYVYIYFWSFEIYNIKNYVKALYLMKQHYSIVKNKSMFFRIIEECVSLLIESLIKERDKSLIYSNKQNDIQDASLVRKFSHLFHSEFKAVIYKQRLTKIINSKIDICDKLINNYASLQAFSTDVKLLVRQIDEIDSELKAALSNDKENVHYLKLLAVINQVLYCYPQQSQEYETLIEEITTRDRSLEKDVIHSISIMEGDVASIVMSYKDQQCSIERYSNRTPNFFGYSVDDFKLIKTPEPLIPDIIAMYHNYYVGRIVREGNPKILRRYRTLVAKNKNGYLFPVKLFADYFFNIHDSLCFSALVLKLKTNCEYILVEHDGYIQGFSQGFFEFLRETSQCYELDPNLLMQANIKIIFPTLLEFLNKYDENRITPNMTTHFRMEIPKRLNDYIQEFLAKREQLKSGESNEIEKKYEFVKKLVFLFSRFTESYFQEQTTTYDVQMRITKDFLSLTKDDIVIHQNLFVLEVSNMTVIKTIQLIKQFQSNFLSRKPRERYKSLHNNTVDPSLLQTESTPLPTEAEKKNDTMPNETIQTSPPLPPTQQQQQQQPKLSQSQQKQNPQRQSVTQTRDITLTKYSSQSLAVSDSKGSPQPASMSIRRQRSRSDPRQQSQEIQESQDGNINSTDCDNEADLSKLNLILKSKVDSVIEESHEDKEKTYLEFKKFCSLTSYLRNNNNNNGSHMSNLFDVAAATATGKNADNEGKEQEEKAVAEENSNRVKEVLSQFADKHSQRSVSKPIRAENDDEDNSDDLDESPENPDENLFNTQKATENNDDDYSNSNYNNNDGKKQQQRQKSFADSKFGGEMSRSKQAATSKRKNGGLVAAAAAAGGGGGGGAQSSFEEKGNAINQNVREICKTATDRSIPVFVKNLYAMFSFQLTVFIIIVIVSCLNYVRNFSAFLTSIEVMSFTSDLLQGQVRVVLATDFMLLSQQKLVDFSHDPAHIHLLQHLLPKGYDRYTSALFQALQWPIQYPALQTFQESQMDFVMWTTKSQEFIQNNQIPVPSCLRMIGQSMFVVQSHANSTSGSESSSPFEGISEETYPRELIVNQRNLLENLLRTNEDVMNSIEDDKTRFQATHIVVLVIGLVSVLLSFALIFSSLRTLQTQEKKILGLISRISEDDAFCMITLLQTARECVAPSNQDYLTVNLPAFEEKPSHDKRSNRMAKKSKQQKIKSNYLNDRITINTLNRTNSYIIVSTLLFVSCATFLIGFLNYEKLISSLEEPLQDNNKFLSAFNDYSTLIQSFDALITDKLLKNSSIESSLQGILTDSQSNILTEDMNKALKNMKAYSSLGYASLSKVSSISTSFSTELQAINEQNSCDLNVFDSVEMEKCSTMMSGLMEKGLIPELNSILNTIEGIVFTLSDANQLQFFVQQQDSYLENTKVAALMISLLSRVKDLLFSSISDLLTSYATTTIFVFICGAIGYTSLLVCGFSYFYITQFRDFRSLRRAVILMPYQRLACDNHTMNLLNNTLRIKK